MNILIVTEYFPQSADCEVRGGVEARAFYFARELAKEHSVSVICSRLEKQKSEDNFLGISVYRCGLERSYAHGGSLLGRVSFLLSAIRCGRSLETDIADGYNFIAYIAVFFITLRKKGVRKIATYHDVWVGNGFEYGIFIGNFREMLERFSSCFMGRIIAV